MEGKKSKPRALLIFGAPCSGKTTFAEQFSKRFDLAYYDLEELKTKYNFSRKQILQILALIVRTDKTIILEGGLATERERDEIRHVLRAAGYDATLVWLQTDITTIRNRLKVRYKSVSKAKEVYDTLVASLEAPSELERPVILSGKHTFETQARHMLAGLAGHDKQQ